MTRYAFNQALSEALNKVLQAHERELWARARAETTTNAPMSVHIANDRALEDACTVRQAAVIEFTDTMLDLIEQQHAAFAA